MDKQIKILIVEDHPVYRAGLKMVLEFVPEINIIGETGDGDEAVKLTKELLPDFVVLDISLNSKSGLMVAKEILAETPEVKIIFLTMHKEKDIFNAAFQLGASAYLIKDDAMDEIINAITAVLNGEKYVSNSLRQYSPAEADSDILLIDKLTLREREILKLIGEAESTKEIAEELFISIKTIENHRTNISAKLNISGHNALMKFAITYREII